MVACIDHNLNSVDKVISEEAGSEFADSGPIDIF